MPDETPNHNLDTYEQGETNWSHSDDMEILEIAVEVRDVDSALNDYQPHDGAKFFAEDTGDIYLGDGDSWNHLGTLGEGGSGGGGGAPTDASYITIESESGLDNETRHVNVPESQLHPPADHDNSRHSIKFIARGGPLEQNIDANTKQIKNAADPTDPQDYATRAWVENNTGSGSDTSGYGGHVSMTGDGTSTTFQWDTGISDPNDIDTIAIDASTMAASVDYRRFTDGTDIGVEYDEPPADGDPLGWYWIVNGGGSGGGGDGDVDGDHIAPASVRQWDTDAPIQGTVLESFASGSMAHYVGDTTPFSVVDSTFDGDSMLDCDFPDTSGTVELRQIQTGSGTTQRGQTYVGYVNGTTTEGTVVQPGFFVLSAWDSNGNITAGYQVRLNILDNSIEVLKWNNGSFVESVSSTIDSHSIAQDQWYRLEIDAGHDGIIGRAYTHDGTHVGAIDYRDVESGSPVYADGFGWGLRGDDISTRARFDGLNQHPHTNATEQRQNETHSVASIRQHETQAPIDGHVTDSYEGGMGHYAGSTGVFSVVSSDIAGDSMLQFQASDGNQHAIATDQVATDRGRSYAGYIRLGADTGIAAGLVLCATIQDGTVTEGYNISLFGTGDAFRIYKKTATNNWLDNQLAGAAVTTTGGTLYRVEVDLEVSGTIRARLYNCSTDTLEATLTPSDTAYDTGGWGHYGASSDGNTADFDLGVQSAIRDSATGGGGGDGAHSVEDDGTEIYPDVATVNFGTDLSVTDDGSNEVTIDSTASTSGSGDGSHNWIDVTSDTYGADPTGTNDSAAAIQQALDDAAAQDPPGTVFLPSGEYLVVSGARLSSSENDPCIYFTADHSGVTLRGEGRSSKIFATADDPANDVIAGIQFTDTDNPIQYTTLQDFWLQGGDADFMKLLDYQDEEHPDEIGNVIHNLWVSESLDIGVQIGKRGTMVNGIRVWNSGRHGFTIHESQSTGLRDPSTVATNVLAWNNGSSEHPLSYGIDLSRGSALLSNFLTWNNGNGIKTSNNARKMIVTNGWSFDNAAKDGSDNGNGLNVIGETADSPGFNQEIMLDNIHCYDNQGGGFSFGSGTNLDVQAGTLFSENNSGYYDVRISGVNSLSIDNLVVRNAPDNGVSVLSDSADVDIGHLTLIDNDTGVLFGDSDAPTLDVLKLHARGNTNIHVDNSTNGGDFWVLRSHDYGNSVY